MNVNLKSFSLKEIVKLHRDFECFSNIKLSQIKVIALHLKKHNPVQNLFAAFREKFLFYQKKRLTKVRLMLVFVEEEVCFGRDEWEVFLGRGNRPALIYRFGGRLGPLF